MRMWFVNPRWMCRQHLLGEHVECHMFFSSYFVKKHNLKGYFKGLFDPYQLQYRHEIITEEMTRRGYKHKTPLPRFTPFNIQNEVWIDYHESRDELLRRCPRCQQLYTEHMSNKTFKFTSDEEKYWR